MKTFESFEENRLQFLGEFKVNIILRKFPSGAEIQKPACKIMRAWTTNEEKFESFKRNLRFWSNLYGKLTFSMMFY